MSVLSGQNSNNVMNIVVEMVPHGDDVCTRVGSECQLAHDNVHAQPVFMSNDDEYDVSFQVPSGYVALTDACYSKVENNLNVVNIGVIDGTIKFVIFRSDATVEGIVPYAQWYFVPDCWDINTIVTTNLPVDSLCYKCIYRTLDDLNDDIYKQTYNQT